MDTSCKCECCRDRDRAAAECAAERAALAATRKALKEELRAHAETRKALAAERARVERVREVFRRWQWNELTSAYDLAAALSNALDALAQAPATVAVSRDAPSNEIARPTAEVSEQAVPTQWGVTHEDLAALRRDAVRDALLAVAEAMDTAERSTKTRPDGTWVTYQDTLRARAGQ